MDNNGDGEGCSSTSLKNRQNKSGPSSTKTGQLSTAAGTLRPKYAGLKGFKKFQQEMARRKAGNLSRELPAGTTTVNINPKSVGGSSTTTVTFNDVPTLVPAGQCDSNSSDSSSVYKKTNGDISFHEGHSSSSPTTLSTFQRKFGPPSSQPSHIAPGSIINQSKILDRPSTGGFININEESEESEEYECRCHLQQSTDPDLQQSRQESQFFTPSSSLRSTNALQTRQKNVHYSIDFEKNGAHLPGTDASSSQSEQDHNVHHHSVTFDVISHPPPVSPLSPNIVANAICPPPPLTNEAIAADSSSVPTVQIKYHPSGTKSTSSSIVQEVSDHSDQSPSFFLFFFCKNCLFSFLLENLCKDFTTALEHSYFKLFP